MKDSLIMKFQEFDIVYLLKDHSSPSLKTGAIGVIVAVYTTPQEAYEVEFSDKEGKTIIQTVFLPSELEHFHEKNEPH